MKKFIPISTAFGVMLSILPSISNAGADLKECPFELAHLYSNGFELLPEPDYTNPSWDYIELILAKDRVNYAWVSWDNSLLADYNFHAYRIDLNGDLGPYVGNRDLNISYRECTYKDLSLNPFLKPNGPPIRIKIYFHPS